jgi:hypothetical protein
MKLTKLDALRILSNAYHHIPLQQGTSTLEDVFHKVRRSLRMEDLRPQPKSTEGLNPKGPTWL